MARLKQMRLIVYAITATTLFFFSACVDKDYNLDDDNLDGSGVWSPGGFTAPVGSVEKMFLYEKIRDLFPQDQSENFSVDADGTIVFQYTGEFDADFDMPSIEAPDIDNVVFNAPGNIPNALIGLPIDPTVVPPGSIMPPFERTATYSVSELPLQGEGWSVESIDSIGFSKCTINIAAKFTGITFSDPGNSSIKLTLTLSDDIILKDEDYRTIEEEIFISEFAGNNQKTVAEIEVAGYKYNSQNAEIEYAMELNLGTETITIGDSNADGSFTFDLDITTDKSGITLSEIKGKIDVVQSVTGSINDFESFFESFGDENILDFRNPALGIELRTQNVGVNSNMNIDLGNNIETNVPLVLNYVPEQTTQIWLSPIEEGFQLPYVHGTMAINKLISSRPEIISYELTLDNHSDNNVVLSYGDMDIKGSYTLKLPFEFDKLDLTVSDTITDMFTKDIYDGFFKNATEDTYLKIISDSVDINFSNPITLTVTANVLDKNGEPIGVSGSGELKNVNADNNTLEITISGLDNMEEAKHLELSFSAKAEPLKLTERDYIHVKSLKLGTNSGFYFE